MAVQFNDMALFVEVVKARSFTRAAMALDMPNSSLSGASPNWSEAWGYAC